MDKTIRVMTFNIHAGLGWQIEGVWERFYRGEYDLGPVIECIRDASPDLVALQEVAVMELHHRKPNQPRELADALGMEYRYGPANAAVIPHEGGEGRGTYIFGNVVLSRFPIIGSSLHRLYRPGERDVVDEQEIEVIGMPHDGEVLYGEGSPGWREPRSLLVTDLDAGSCRLRFGSTHLSYIGYRQICRQAEEVVELTTRSGFPAIVGGDFNRGLGSRSLEPLYDRMQETLLVAGEPSRTAEATWPTKEGPRRDLDHIFVSSSVQVERAWVERAHPRASDHFPVLADIWVE